MSALADGRLGRPRSVFIEPGQRFGMLAAIKELQAGHRGRWLFQCDCGTFLSRQVDCIRFAMKNGSVANCGCETKRIRSASGKLKTITGLSVTHRRLYDVHRQMLQRCENESSKDFVNYGARGISVCAEWRDPVVFVAWAEDSGYRRGLTIERRDVNGDYCPENCTWIANERQSHNTRRNVFLEIDGVRKHIADWARSFGVKWPTVSSRIRSGWSLLDAVSVPVKSKQSAERIKP